MFQIHNVIRELIDKMATGLPENVKLQISLENTTNNMVSQTKLSNKTDYGLKLEDWVILFIHAEHVVHRRGYCFHFGCMYVCMFVCMLAL